MPGLTQRNNDEYQLSNCNSNAFWSKHRDDVCYNQLQKFWTELSLEARQQLLRIDKQTLFEQARKNSYCSRCNGLLLECFMQIVMYGKSKQQGASTHISCSISGASSNKTNVDDIQDPSIHPWGGLINTRDATLTLLDCYLYSKSLKRLQNVFDSARARERERELLYPDACGGGERGWISQGIAPYGRGHGTRETCALHTARLTPDTLVDFWSALEEETRLSLLRMKEEDFIERLMYRFDSKRFCRDCRRNVIREFKELKELKRMRRDTRCTTSFCAADTAFQYEVSEGTVQADWRQNFTDAVGTYHHFEWAIGTGEGKCDILEYENVGMNGGAQVNGLDLGGLSACYITLRAWKLDGRCTEICVKAHALNGQQCVHCKLVVGDGFVTITRAESIRRFFEHAEEAEEEEDDDSIDKDRNEMDGECARPQKHAKSPELAREFLLDATTVIFKEQVEKAFREGTARQNAHSIFVCLALKLLEECVHVACKEIITLEKQTKLLEEEEKEKLEEEERKERKRTKEKEKKLRRKERLKGREKDKTISDSNQISEPIDISKEESSPSVDDESNSTIISEGPICVTDDPILLQPYDQDEHFPDGFTASPMQNHSYDDGANEEYSNANNENNSFTIENLKYSRRRIKFSKEFQPEQVLNWSDRRRSTAVTAVAVMGINGARRQLRVNGVRPNTRNCNSRFSEKFHSSSSNRISEKQDFHPCCCNQTIDYRSKNDRHVSPHKTGYESKFVNKPESASDVPKQFYRGTKYNQQDYTRENCGRSKGSNPPSRDSLYTKQVWEPIESSQKKYPKSNPDFDLTSNSSTLKVEGISTDNLLASGEVTANFGETYHEAKSSKELKENGSFDTLGSSTSNTDNCSSEGDSNSASFTPPSPDSALTSDSEDASDEIEASTYVQNESGEYHKSDMESTQIKNGGEWNVNAVNDVPVIPDTRPAQHLENGKPIINLGYQHQSMPTQVQNHNMHYPMFQAAQTTMAYHHQNTVTWPSSVPANNLMVFPQHSHYVYASPLGYGLNSNSPYCLEYGSMQHLPNPLMNQSHILDHHPVSAMNSDDQTKILNLGRKGQEPLKELEKERIISDGPRFTGVPVGAEDPKPKLSGKSHTENKNFSLFHFGGPVALAAGCDSNPVSMNISPDYGSDGHASNKKETTIEEYSLFAASNGLKFSFF